MRHSRETRPVLNICMDVIFAALVNLGVMQNLAMVIYNTVD